MTIQKGDNIRVRFTGTDVSMERKVLAVAVDGTFMIVEEGPGLSATLRFNPAQPVPTWRLDGAAVELGAI